MLKLSTHELGNRPVRLKGNVPLEGEPWASTELTFVDLPHVDLSVRVTGDGGIHVTGDLSGTVEIRCRRCLEPVHETLHIQVDWLFEPDLDEDGEAKGVFVLDIEREGELDLTPRIREEFLLEVPAYPLCEDDCSGLCPVCGINLNESSCNCDTSHVDPRWGPLQDLAST